VGEVIEVKGYNGTVRFDGRAIAIVRKGFLARATVGKGEKQIPLAHVTAVQFKPAGRMVNGFIQFTLGGGNERRSLLGTQTIDAAQDENSVIFQYRQRKQFEELRDIVQAAIADHHAGAAAPHPAGVPEQIKQLGDLREAGLLTDEEFESKKAELLRRM
jgi:Domain of unknown function (DUF4429)/Short C-terminal domain